MGFLDQLSIKYNITLNKQQQQAVRHVNGPALILAGPGSGKTTVITARTAYLISDLGAEPGQILTLTFNKAAQLEMERRFNRIYGQDIGEKVHFSTLHSFCNKVVRDYERRQGKRLKRIEGENVEGENKRLIIKNLYQQINESRINDDDLENLVNEIGLVKNKMIKSFEGMTFSTKSFEAIFKAYEEYKRSNLYIDFDDMLTYAYSILIKCPDILSYYIDKYQYIQIDEGQDLSKIQFEILKLIIKPEKNNVFIVADDDQSIYGFRGAEPQYILNIQEQLRECRLYWLENNYRSSRNIVELSSKFIKSNTQRFDKNHSTENDHMLDPNIVRVQNEKEQIEFIINKIKEHRKKGQSLAVLFRNNLSSISIVDALERDNISFKIKQNKLFFFSHWIVQDILAFIHFALNQCDREAFSRVYYKMNRFISKNMLEYALNTECTVSIIDGIISNADIKPYQSKTLNELKIEFRKMSKMAPLYALEYIENSFKYFDSVKDYCEKTGVSYSYSYSLFGILKSIAKGCTTLPLFLKRIDKLQELLEKSQNTDNAVTLTTMHSSKGLEYDTVLMVDLTEEETPGTKVVENAKKNNDNSVIEEERRLFYVGMTRAKEYLYLVSPAEKNGIPVKRSTFINEVVGIMNKNAVNEFGEGMVINHKRFGEGIVTAILDLSGGKTLIEVEFQSGRRKLDFGICMENGLIYSK